MLKKTGLPPVVRARDNDPSWNSFNYQKHEKGFK